MRENLKAFKEYYSLSVKLIDEMSKDDLAECARLMALHLAHYQRTFGNLSECEVLSALGIAELTRDDANLLRDGMQILTGYLSAMRDEPGCEAFLH